MLIARNPEKWIAAAKEETSVVRQVYSLINNPRMSAQQSVLTMGGSLCIPQDVALEEMLDDKMKWRIVIKSSLKNAVVKHLDGMNINCYSLFGGAAGVGRYVRDRVARDIGVPLSVKLAQQAMQGAPDGPTKE